ncbi:MAG: aminotransferase class III-fold pyridoxal phosphate-dependent enzyme [Aestuariivirga sp.]|nr:aminotransferase class III-fold pyridoxal phosphate-dependent enzyme [Aestuariivirga sp.]
MKSPRYGRNLEKIFARESELFASRTVQSRNLLSIGRGVMPDGVPMAWMAGLYRHQPIFVSHGSGSRFHDVDGNSYIDFNLSDLSNTIGHGENAVSRRVSEQAARGMQFLLPGEDAIAVSQALRDRVGLPMWQYTLSASAANAEVIRISRAYTGRQKVVIFEGKYHGHIEVTMAEGGGPGANAPAKPDGMGVSASATADTVNVPLNDLAAPASALQDRDVALVLTEPALTNCSLVLPEPGFLHEAYRLTKETGALLALDETHTWQFAYGGLVREHGLSADFVTLGKGLGSGMPLGAYGMTAELGRFVEENRDVDIAKVRGLAIGGTTYGSAITLAAARAVLEEVLTEEGYRRMAALGGRLADGIDGIIARYNLPWRAFRYGPRSGFCLGERLPQNAEDAVPSLDRAFSDARRVFMANRGIWEAIASAGPQTSFVHTEPDIDRYLEVAEEFIAEMTAD